MMVRRKQQILQTSIIPGIYIQTNKNLTCGRDHVTHTGTKSMETFADGATKELCCTVVLYTWYLYDVSCATYRNVSGWWQLETRKPRPVESESR